MSRIRRVAKKTNSDPQPYFFFFDSANLHMKIRYAAVNSAMKKNYGNIIPKPRYIQNKARAKSGFDHGSGDG